MSNPIPYLIVFFILVIVLLAAITWAMYEYNKLSKCLFDPNIWCRTDWKCKNTCPNDQNVLNCYKGNLPQGTTMTECIYKYITDELKGCYNMNGNNQNPIACTCPIPSDTQNCLSNCAMSINDLPESAKGACCCKGPGCAQSTLCIPPSSN